MPKSLLRNRTIGCLVGSMSQENSTLRMYAPGSVIDLLRVSAMSHDPAIDHGDVLAPKPADHESQSRRETRVRPSVSRRHGKTPRLICSLVPILAMSYRTE